MNERIQTLTVRRADGQTVAIYSTPLPDYRVSTDNTLRQSAEQDGHDPKTHSFELSFRYQDVAP